MADLVVMVVDDEVSWVDFARPLFASRGIHLLHSTSLEAVAELATERVDALVCNAHIVSDWDRLGAICSRGQVPKVVVLTNTKSTSAAVQALRRGADYTTKPFSRDGVDELITFLLATLVETPPRLEHPVKHSVVRVLIVEDLHEWQQIFARALSEIPDLKLAVVSTYHQALDALSRDSFQLVITDLRLIDKDSHNIDGFVLLKKLFESGADTKIILTSGFASTDLIREATIKYQAVDFFLKSPDSGRFELERFIHCVAELVNEIKSGDGVVEPPGVQERHIND